MVGDDDGSMLMMMIVRYLQGGQEDADFVPCPESYLELTNGQTTKQVFESTVLYALAVLKTALECFMNIRLVEDVVVVVVVVVVVMVVVVVVVVVVVD